MTAISAFRSVVVPFLHGCPDIAADIAVRFALREFCEKTDWLQFEHDDIVVVPGQSAYEFEPPSGTEVVRVISASLNGWLLDARSQDNLRALLGDWRSRDGTPRYFTQIIRSEAVLVPRPDEAGVLSVIASLHPQLTAVAVDDSLYQRWSETIGYGARARLKEMSGQPYYDPPGALSCWTAFHRGMEEAKAERAKDFTRAVQHVQLREWV